MPQVKNLTIAFSWNEKTEAALIKAYEAVNKDNGKLSEIGKQFDNKTEASIRQKLVHLKAYQPNEPTSTTGGKVTPRKCQTRKAVETMLSLPVDSLDTLDKGSKQQLELLAKKLIAYSDKQAADAQTKA